MRLHVALVCRQHNDSRFGEFITDGQTALNPEARLATFKARFDAGKMQPVEVATYLRMLENAGAKRELIPSTFQKITSKKKLYHYDSLEPLERDRLVI